jgi:hypothetical protein
MRPKSKPTVIVDAVFEVIPSDAPTPVKECSSKKNERALVLVQDTNLNNTAPGLRIISLISTGLKKLKTLLIATTVENPRVPTIISSSVPPVYKATAADRRAAQAFTQKRRIDVSNDITEAIASAPKRQNPNNLTIQ